MKQLYFYSILFVFLPASNLFAQVVADYKSVINNNHITLHVDSNQMKYSFQVKKVNFKASPDYTYHWYGAGKILQNQGSYSGKVLHGDFSSYYPNKLLAEKGTFKNGLKSGTWLNWNTDGYLKSSFAWKNGIKNGKYVIYASEGKISEMGKMTRGYKQGKATLIDSLNHQQAIQYYDHGKQISKEEYIQMNPWRRAGKYIQDKWKGLFRKKQKDSTENLTAQLFN